MLDQTSDERSDEFACNLGALTEDHGESDVSPGTYTGTQRRHNGYYAGDFTHSPICTSSELSALAQLQLPTFPTKSGNAD